jgi:DNA-binding transcriptional ArsR family regulator
MPVKFDEYEAASEAVEWAIDPESNAYTILAFLARHPEVGFTPSEIHEATELPRGSVGTTLRRLEERGFLRHKEPYWAVDREGLKAYEAILTSVRTVEDATTYDWTDADPDDYRIGLDAVREDTTDGSD